MMTSTLHRADCANEIDDAELGRVLGMGAAIGIPVIFVVAALLSLGAGFTTALAIAVWPTLVGGPFVGGFAVLMKLQHEPRVHAAVMPLPRPNPAPLVTERHAA